MQITIYLSEERSHWEQRTAAKSVVFIRETQPISKTAAHERGIRSNNQTSGYTQIKKKFLVYRKQNSLVYTKYTCIYIYQNIWCAYYLQCKATTMTLCSEQYINNVGRCSMRIYKCSTGFRTPAVDQSYWSIYYNHDLNTVLHSEGTGDEVQCAPSVVTHSAIVYGHRWVAVGYCSSTCSVRWGDRETPFTLCLDVHTTIQCIWHYICHAQ